jgi:hypothetical protein
MRERMRAISVSFLLIAASCGASESPVATAAAPAAIPQGIEGVWTVDRVRLETGETAGSHTFDVQPSVVIFRDNYYAIVAVSGFAARPYLGSEPALEEIGRAYTPFIGHSGTYTVVDTTLTLAPQVAKDPAQMSGTATIVYDLAWNDVGDAVLKTNTDANGEVEIRLARVVEDNLQLSPVAQRLQGVWRRAERVLGTGDAAEVHLEDMQPGFYIFEDDKFAANFVTSFAPRRALGAKPTDKDYGEVFGAYASYAGTFSEAGNELVLWPKVSLNPNNMRGPPFRPFRLEWQGDDVWFIYPIDSGIETRTRITRIAE